jgi:hypothetical protein
LHLFKIAKVEKVEIYFFSSIAITQSLGKVGKVGDIFGLILLLLKVGKVGKVEKYFFS